MKNQNSDRVKVWVNSHMFSMAYARRNYIFIFAVSYVGDMGGALRTMPMLHPGIYFKKTLTDFCRKFRFKFTGLLYMISLFYLK